MSFALSRLPEPGSDFVIEVDLWCYWETEKDWDGKSIKHKCKGRSFYVINGDWYGHFDKKTGVVTCHSPLGDSVWQAAIVWEGNVPARKYRIEYGGEDYNSAMAWIREQLAVQQ